MEELKPIAFSVRFNTINNLDVFVKRVFKDLVIDSLITLKKNYAVLVYGYVIMPDHICLVMAPESQKELAIFCERFKQTISQKVMELLEGDRHTEKRWLLFLINFINKDNSESGANKIWNLDYILKPLSNNDELDKELGLLHQMPIDEGIVSRPEDYNYSSSKENIVESFFLNRQAV